MKKFNIFVQKHGLTALEKRQYYDFLELMFLWSRMLYFLSRTARNTFFFGLFHLNRKDEEF